MNDEPPDDDAALFRAAMRHVRKLDPRPRVLPSRRTSPASGSAARSLARPKRDVPNTGNARNSPVTGHRPKTRDAFNELFPVAAIARTVAGDERLSYRRPGLQDSVLRKLRRGQFPVGAEIDLHGLTANQADVALRRFLGAALARGVRCVRIVHGKGHRSGERGAVLKSTVTALLEHSPAVLAFVSASVQEGGTGATSVLLRGAASL